MNKGAHDQILTSLERMNQFVSALKKRGTTLEEDRARQERFQRAAALLPLRPPRPSRRWWQFWK